MFDLYDVDNRVCIANPMRINLLKRKIWLNQITTKNLRRRMREDPGRRDFIVVATYAMDGSWCCFGCLAAY